MIRLIRPYISFEEVKDEFAEILESGILTKGKYSLELPKRLNEYLGCKYSFLATSATTALAACLEILQIGKGDEVIVSDFSFPASVNVIEACQARPVFADVDKKTYNMDPGELKRKITKNTKAVIFVCALGNPSGILEIRDICRDAGIPLIDDAACGIGSSVNGIKAGNITDLECFSFHPRKLLTSGEGGAITTNNDAYADILKVKLMHGSAVTENGLEFVTYGYNYRLPELQCVMLIKQLEKLDRIVARRAAIYEQYKNALEPFGFAAQQHDANTVHNMQSTVFTVPEGKSRNDLIVFLKEAGVETTIGTYCLSNCKYYRYKYNEVQKVSKYLEENTITLPCYDGVDIDMVIKSIKKFI